MVVPACECSTHMAISASALRRSHPLSRVTESCPGDPHARQGNARVHLVTRVCVRLAWRRAQSSMLRVPSPSQLYVHLTHAPASPCPACPSFSTSRSLVGSLALRGSSVHAPAGVGLSPRRPARPSSKRGGGRYMSSSARDVPTSKCASVTARQTMGAGACS